MQNKTLLVFVHLGMNPSPSLLSMAKAALHHNPNLEIALITDSPNLHKEFPGKLVSYDRHLINPWIRSFIAKRREIKDIAGGYWLHTLERIFALNAIIPLIQDQIVLHIESDVYLNISEELIHEIAKRLDRIAIPRFSSSRGIASILIAPTPEILKRDLEKLQYLLLQDSKIDSDMVLLGQGLNAGLLSELTGNPQTPFVLNRANHDSAKFIFDAAALGQYLFGQDPFHTEGRRISGFINPDAPFDPSEYSYSIKKSQMTELDALYINDTEIINLHIHSKLELPSISRTQEIWNTAINEANGTITRTADAFRPDHIHTTPISFLNRARIAKRNGLIFSSINAAKKRLLKVLNHD